MSRQNQHDNTVKQGMPGLSYSTVLQYIASVIRIIEIVDLPNLNTPIIYLEQVYNNANLLKELRNFSLSL